MNNALQTVEMDQPRQVVAQATTPATLLQMAITQGADLDRLERLMELQERYEANEARKAYVSAMAAFKRNPPEIIKDKHVKFGNTEYKHATLGNVVNVVVGALAEHGFSHRWKPTQKDGKITVACILTHQQGHSEETVLEASPDTSGAKNSIQAIASTVSYLERYTLLSASGLATSDMDDDADVSEATAWVEKALAAKTLTDLDDIWAKGSAYLEKAKDRNGYAKLKATLRDKKAELAK